MERHILIVDDEPNILNTLQRLLEEEDYVVYRADCGQKGIDIIDANPQIGVVLSDQRMPNMTGTEFLKQIKLKHQNVVRMILSGYSELSTITNAINEGSIFKFLTKPWEDDLLLN
ncbi:MAG: response regulator, partial [Ketobacter sp.]